MGNHHSHQENGTKIDGCGESLDLDGSNPKPGHKGKKKRSFRSRNSDSVIECSVREEKDSLKLLFQKLSAQSGACFPDLPENTVSQEVFEGAFDGPLHLFGKLLYKAVTGGSGQGYISKEHFVRECRKVMDLYLESERDRFYFFLYSEGQCDLSLERLERMIEDTYAITMAEAHFNYVKSDLDAQVLEALVKGIISYRSSVTFDDFDHWKRRHCPQLFDAIHTFVMSHMTAAHKIKHPALSRKSSVPQMGLAGSGQQLCQGFLWVLSNVLSPYFTNPSSGKPPDKPQPLLSRSLHLKRVQGWVRLFNSDEDGISFNRFNLNVSHYRGPTCLFVQFEGRNVYCVAVDQEWRDGQELWGGPECTCVQLLPVYRLVANGEKMLSFNLRSRAVPMGLRVGKDAKNMVLDIPPSLDKVKSYGHDYKLHSIEVWGCAGKDIREAQIEHRQWEHRETEKLRETRIKLEGWDDNPDRKILEWGGIKHTNADAFR